MVVVHDWLDFFLFWGCLVLVAYLIVTTHMYRTDQNVPAEPKPCAMCRVPFKVQSLHMLRPGEHVSMSGSRFRSIPAVVPWSLYRHHTIISDVLRIDDNGQTGQLLVKGFECLDTTDGNEGKKGLHVQEREVEVNVRHVQLESIYYIDAAFETVDRILENLERLAKERWEYNFGAQNCEHFCSLVWTGTGYSRQVHRFVQSIYMVFRVPLINLVLIYGILEHFVYPFTRISAVPVAADDVATGVAYFGFAAYFLYTLLRCYGVRWCRYKKPVFHVSKETCKRHRIYFIIKSIYKMCVLYVIFKTQVVVVTTFHHSTDDTTIIQFYWLAWVMHILLCILCLYYVPRQVFRIFLHCIIFYRHPHLYVPLYFS